MNAPRLYLSVLGIIAGVLLAGCDPNAAAPALVAAPAFTADSFGWGRVLIDPGSRGTVVINKPVGGSISVVAYPPSPDTAPKDEVSLDYIVVGQGANAEAALRAARQQIVTIKGIGNNTQIEVEAPAAGLPNTVQLFVRVPEESNVIINSSAGDVSVFGSAQDVTARLTAGNIEVRGILGNARLETGKGSIQSAQRSPAATLVLSTTEGNITTFAVNAKVTANIARQGSIRFVGTLRDFSEFHTAGDGDVIVVLPESSSYLVRAIGGEKVSVDYTSAAEVCGAFSGKGGYRYEALPTDDRYGRVDVSGAGPDDARSVDGVMGKDFYFFTTDRPDVVFAPPPQNPIMNIASPGQSMGVCSNPKQPSELIKSLPPPPVSFNISAEQGRIVVHYIHMETP